VIEISATAVEYFKHLLSQQGEEGLGLRIAVDAPGTPRAECDLQFCPPGSHALDDEKLSFDGFDLYVAASSRRWLEGAEIDFEREGTAGQLSIKAPGIKGNAPGDDAPLAQRVSWVVDNEINPMLASHGGRVALVDITEKTEVVLQFGGGCHGCGMVDVTLKEGIEKTLIKHFPQITGIVDATDHDSGENPYYAG
jgi:Fe/S biogenesis protein NfuA